jgi:hypothetical protein
MVKLYLKNKDEIVSDDKGKYLNLSLLSCIKVCFIGTLAVVGMLFGLSIIIGIFRALLILT